MSDVFVSVKARRVSSSGPNAIKLSGHTRWVLSATYCDTTSPHGLTSFIAVRDRLLRVLMYRQLVTLSDYMKYREYRDRTERLAAQFQGLDGNKQAWFSRQRQTFVHSKPAGKDRWNWCIMLMTAGPLPAWECFWRHRKQWMLCVDIQVALIEWYQTTEL